MIKICRLQNEEMSKKIFAVRLKTNYFEFVIVQRKYMCFVLAVLPPNRLFSYFFVSY